MDVSNEARSADPLGFGAARRRQQRHEGRHGSMRTRTRRLRVRLAAAERLVAVVSALAGGIGCGANDAATTAGPGGAGGAASSAHSSTTGGHGGRGPGSGGA